MDPKNLIIPDFLTLTVMMSYIQHACVDAMKHLTVYAQRLMYLLAGIDLVVSVILNLEEADHIKILIKKIIKYGFFIYLIANYNSLLNVMMKGFMFFGKVAGLSIAKPLTEVVVTNPAILGTYGIYLIKDAVNIIIGQGTSTVTSDPVLLMNIGILLAIAASYFMVGINLFLLYVEFYVLGALSIILVPFGVNQYTSFISQKVLNAMLSIGIKLMVTVFIIGLVMPFMLAMQPLGPNTDDINNAVTEITNENGEKVKVVDAQSLQKYLYLLLPCLAMAFLTIHGPNLAMNLLSGGGSFNASTAVGGLMSMGRMPQTLSNFSFSNKSQGVNTKNESSDSKYPLGNNPTGINTGKDPAYENVQLSASNMVDNYEKNLNTKQS